MSIMAVCLSATKKKHDGGAKVSSPRWKGVFNGGEFGAGEIENVNVSGGCTHRNVCLKYMCFRRSWGASGVAMNHGT